MPESTGGKLLNRDEFIKVSSAATVPRLIVETELSNPSVYVLDCSLRFTITKWTALNTPPPMNWF